MSPWGCWPEGGVISLQCENVSIGQDDIIALQEGEYVRISLEDRGVGIPEEHISRIFDPFFTTKQKGSGLGLATSYSITKKHDGLITVNSKPGAGAIFNVYLPASEKEATSVSREMNVPVSGAGKILVMDDEEIILSLAGDILGYLGYEVELADSGEEAIGKFQKARDSGEPYDLLIMDLTIPGAMGGKEAIALLLRIDPRVKAIVSSGYSNDPVLADYRKHGFSGVVTKPYRVTELSQIVYEVIKKD